MEFQNQREKGNFSWFLTGQRPFHALAILNLIFPKSIIILRGNEFS